MMVFFSQVHSDVSGVMSRAVSRPLLEKTFHMKIQSRKVFTHRESYETILAKTEDMLRKCHVEYCHAFDAHASAPSAAAAAAVVEAHNTYVQQLRAANGMLEQYYRETLPQLLQELDDVYGDVGAVVAETMAQGAEIMAIKVRGEREDFDFALVSGKFASVNHQMCVLLPLGLWLL